MAILEVGGLVDWNIKKGSSFEDICNGIKSANADSNYFFGEIVDIIDSLDYVIVNCHKIAKGFILSGLLHSYKINK